jgi:hypothetical protein
MRDLISRRAGNQRLRPGSVAGAGCLAEPLAVPGSDSRMLSMPSSCIPPPRTITEGTSGLGAGGFSATAGFAGSCMAGIP